MHSRVDIVSQAKDPTFAELFTPKIVTVLRDGYGVVDFRADVLAGLTVAIVALPLSMAIRLPQARPRSAAFTRLSSAVS
jgi:sulfate permease, SulP family